MFCEKHKKPMQEVCGEFSCASCFEESMRGERVPKREKRGPGHYEEFVSEVNHMLMLRWVAE